MVCRQNERFLKIVYFKDNKILLQSQIGRVKNNDLSCGVLVVWVYYLDKCSIL